MPFTSEICEFDSHDACTHDIYVKIVRQRSAVVGFFQVLRFSFTGRDDRVG